MKRKIDFHIALIILVVFLGSTIFLMGYVVDQKQQARLGENEGSRLINKIVDTITPLRQTPAHATGDILPLVFSFQPSVINPETETVTARVTLDLYEVADMEQNLWDTNFILRIWNKATGRQLYQHSTSLNQWWITQDYQLVKTFSIPASVFRAEETNGTYTAVSYLDFTNRIPERIETNNDIQADFEIKNSIPLMPNFAIENVTLTNANTGVSLEQPFPLFKRGDVIVAQINVRNISNMPGQACRFELGMSILSDNYPQWVYKESFQTFVHSGAVISSPPLYIAFIDDGPTQLSAEIFNTSVVMTCQETEYDDNYYIYDVFDVGP